MTILGIDVGYDRCGFAVVDVNTMNVMDSGVILTDRELSFIKRLRVLREDMLYIQNKYFPVGVCIEKLFFYRRNKVFEKICMSKGVVLEIFADTVIYEIEPSKMKKDITGFGKATKEDIKKALSLRLGVNLEDYIDDELDAISLALYGAQNTRLSNFLHI
ncbi:MAG: crossover junction endodeoxyribonuclease RuvC [Candidatus Dojkabacteria bacterium]|jgi:crossover junction endodeoxyribonuclease RuvC|nr:MAG: crossover junction endodeoxyribonuclease RuvC [Candidatus Dojkabacteria bacterium]